LQLAFQLTDHGAAFVLGQCVEVAIKLWIKIGKPVSDERLQKFWAWSTGSAQAPVREFFHYTYSAPIRAR
jgi:hypothetical protein